MSSAFGCLAPAPPDFQKPGQTPPVFLLDLAKPRITAVIQKQPRETIPFRIPFRSEDVGEPLDASLWRNLGSSSQVREDVLAGLEPGHLEDEGRQVEIDYTVPEGLTDADGHGCHSLTVLLHHHSNFDVVTLLPADRDRAALATWWLSVQEPDSENLADLCGEEPQ